MPICYLGLGSNLRSPKRQLQLAIKSIQRIKNIYIKDISNFYFNKPLGRKAQPMFYNLVIRVNTNIPPHTLLQKLKLIETQQNRVTKIKWGARTIDIDILLYGNKKIKSKALTIPHPEMLNRDFVLIPLAEITEKPISDFLAKQKNVY